MGDLWIKVHIKKVSLYVLVYTYVRITKIRLLVVYVHTAHTHVVFHILHICTYKWCASHTAHILLNN